MKRLVYCFFVLIAFVMNLTAQDVHSYANPSAVRVRHVDLNWEVLFDQKILKGTTTLSIERTSQTEPLILDTRDLKIEKVETSVNGSKYTPATFTVGTVDKILGAPLIIPLPPGPHAFAFITRRLRALPACNGSSRLRLRAKKTLSCSLSRRRFTHAAGFPCRTRPRFG